MQDVSLFISQIRIGTQQLMMLRGPATPGSWHRRAGSRYHYHPAWCKAWSEQRLAGARWRCSRSSWRWSCPTCPCCSGSGISSRRRGRWGGWCHTTTGGWRRWTTTTWLSCPVWVPGEWGTSGKWTKWTKLCGGRPSWHAKVSPIFLSIFFSLMLFIKIKTLFSFICLHHYLVCISDPLSD